MHRQHQPLMTSPQKKNTIKLQIFNILRPKVTKILTIFVNLTPDF
jgi:hypothetical protein